MYYFDFRPVLEDPNFYGQKIITHLNHLFIPRKGEGRLLLFKLIYENKGVMKFLFDKMYILASDLFKKYD